MTSADEDAEDRSAQVRTYSFDDIAALKPCHRYMDNDWRLLRQLVGAGVTKDQIAQSDIPWEDKIWVLLRLMPLPDVALFARDCAKFAAARAARYAAAARAARYARYARCFAAAARDARDAREARHSVAVDAANCAARYAASYSDDDAPVLALALRYVP